MRKAINGALLFEDKKKRDKFLAYFYYQYTLIFQEENKHLDSALFYHSKSLELREKLQNRKDIPKSHMSIGYIHYKQGNNEKALKSLLIADSLYRELEGEMKPNAWLRNKITTNSYLGMVYFSEGDYLSCIELFKKVASQSQRISMKEISLNSYKFLADSYEKLNQLDSAFFYLTKFIQLNDVVHTEKKNQQIEELKTVYETEKKNEIIEQQKETIGYSEKQINRFTIALSTLIILIIFLIVFLRFKRLKNQREMQSKFSQDLINTIEEDRIRIARDLHDSIGQNLLIIKNQNALMGKRLKDEQLIEKSKIINSISAETIEELREISNNLTPYQLGRLGLTKAIEDLIGKIERSSKMSFIKEIKNVDDMVEIDQQINVYRIIQESLNNIIKHSEASEVKIQISDANIVISDNGIGFVAISKTQGMGLNNLVERAKLLKADLTIDSAQNSGTVIAIQFKNN
jgi:signal transduction histidine kinase